MKIEHSSSRREFVKKAAYVAPAILTLQAAPAYAKAGSGNSTGSRRENLVQAIQDRKDVIKERITNRIRDRINNR